jgi:hypothetical protein
VNLRLAVSEVCSFLSEEGVEIHHGDTEDTEIARRVEISNLKFEISDLKSLSLRATLVPSVSPW